MNLAELIENHGLAERERFILEHAMECVRAVAELANEEEIPIGATKLGGFPDVPPGFDWPHIQPYPMTLLAQINCAEVSGILENELLPKSGLLHIFIQTDEEGLIDFGEGEQFWKWIHSEGQPLARQEPPFDSEFHYNPRRLDMWSGISIPDDFDELVATQEFSDSELDNYSELYEAMGGRTHQLLGHPGLLQPTDYAGSNLILQVVSDDDDFMWADCGLLHFLCKQGAKLQDVELMISSF